MISNQTVYVSNTLTAGVTAFSFAPMTIWADSELRVVVTDSAGVRRALTLNTDYTVNRNNSTVNFVTAPYTTYGAGSIEIASAVPYSQEDDYSYLAFSPDRVEKSLDRATVQLLQLAYAVESAPGSLGDLLSQTRSAEQGAVAARAAALISETASKASEDAAKASETASKASENASKASETASKASENASKASETASKASENASKASETNAAGSASTATTRAGEAANSATSAAGSATTATTKAGEAAASATAAQQAAAGISGGFSNMQVFTASGNFTVPAGVQKILAEVWGAGGGGGGVLKDDLGNNNYMMQGGSGGGGGGYGRGVFNVTPGTTLAVTVGAKGAKGTIKTGSGSPIPGNNGGAGGSSSVGALISATGGGGGGGGYVDAGGYSYPGAAGAGGSSSASLNLTGTPGKSGGTQANYTNTAGGDGGAARLGVGDAAISSQGSVAPVEGKGIGFGGAGGCGVAPTPVYAGTDGGPGLVIIYY